MPMDIFEKIAEFIPPHSWIWAIWGMAMYLNQVRKGQKFTTWMFIVNILLAMWVWYLAWEFIPDSFWNIKNSMISICWFLSYPILDLLEKRGLPLILKKIVWNSK
jgi:hypothetical protein